MSESKERVESTLGNGGSQVLLDIGVEGSRWVQGQQVCKHTSGVGGGHGGTAHGCGGGIAADEGRKDVQTWGKDVDTFSMVREVRPLIS